MSVRDAVIDLRRYPQSDGSIVYIVKSLDRRDYPETKGTVRMDLWQGKKIFGGRWEMCLVYF